MEDFRAPAERFLEGRSADGHDHEFLRVDGVGGVGAAVEDVHHRDGQAVAADAAQEAVQRDIQAGGRRAGAGDGDSQDGIGAQVALVLGAVGFDHRSVDGVNIGSVHAQQGVVDDGIDVFDRLLHALAQIAGLVAVAQLEGLKFARGRAAGGHAAADGAVDQRHFRFNGGVSAGVKNLAADDLFNPF